MPVQFVFLPHQKKNWTEVEGLEEHWLGLEKKLCRELGRKKGRIMLWGYKGLGYEGEKAVKKNCKGLCMMFEKCKY